jgi:hypothetical protein
VRPPFAIIRLGSDYPVVVADTRQGTTTVDTAQRAFGLLYLTSSELSSAICRIISCMFAEMILALQKTFALELVGSWDLINRNVLIL